MNMYYMYTLISFNALNNPLLSDLNGLISLYYCAVSATVLVHYCSRRRSFVHVHEVRCTRVVREKVTFEKTRHLNRLVLALLHLF